MIKCQVPTLYTHPRRHRILHVGASRVGPPRKKRHRILDIVFLGEFGTSNPPRVYGFPVICRVRNKIKFHRGSGSRHTRVQNTGSRITLPNLLPKPSSIQFHPFIPCSILRNISHTSRNINYSSVIHANMPSHPQGSNDIFGYFIKSFQIQSVKGSSNMYQP
jgi:hypothetical protein